MMDMEDAKTLGRSAAILVVAFVTSPLLGWIAVLLLGADFVLGDNDE